VGLGCSFRRADGEKVARAAGEAASAIRRFVEEAKAAVRPVVAIASKALVEVGKRLANEREWERFVDVGLADAEFMITFNVAGRPLYFVYTAGDVEFGAVKAKGVKAVAFVSGEKMLRFEILAEGVEGLAAEAKRVKALGREWVRLATFEIDVGSGIVRLYPRVDVSASVVAEPVLAKQLPALVLTDAGMGGEFLGSPDPTFHLLYALAVGEAVVKVREVVFTEVGPTLHLESRTSAKRINQLYGKVLSELKKLGVVVGVEKLRRMAKSAAVEAIGEYAGEVKRIVKEVESVEELRVKLIELFDKAMREAAVKYKEAKDKREKKEALRRAVGAAFAKKFFAENVDDPVWWTLLLLGDGVVFVRNHVIGFAAKPVEAAEAVMYVFARVMGVSPEVQRLGKSAAVLSREASRAAVERLFKRLEEAKIGNAPASQLLTAVAEWWLDVGTGGSKSPKLLSLLAFRELAAGKVDKWFGAWLSYEAVVTPAPEELARWLDGVYRVSVEPPQRGAVGFDVYFERGGERFRLYTDFTNFRLYCESCRDAAEGVLRAVAEALGVEPRWHRGALVLPAGVGWVMFLKLWARYNMSLRVEEGGRELLRVEVLEARADGTAKFRLWYYKWRETRPHQPYVDVEITYKGERQGFIGYISANKGKGILREHLAEIADLLKRRSVEGVSLVHNDKELYFTGAFRDSVLAKVGIKPELPPGEPAAVQYLGGLKFKVGDREVEFSPKAVGARRELYAEVTFPSKEEAERFAKSLKAVGVDARIAGSEKDGYKVRLDSDSFFGLLAATDATPPGLMPLYSSEEGGFRVYASVEEGRTRFYFAVKHGDVWRVAEGLYSEKSWEVELTRTEREVLEAIRDAVARALGKLGRSADVGEPKEYRNEEGNVVGYRLSLHDHHLAPLLEHAAKTVRAEAAEVRPEGRRIVVEASGVGAEVEFKLLKGSEAEFLPVQDVAQALTLYKSLRALGVPVEITPRGVKIDRETMWALVAVAVERDTPSVLPAEVMPGIELLKVHNAGGVEMYIFRAEGVHYYFAVKMEKEWRAAGGKYSNKQVVQIYGEAARVVAEAINAIYREMGVDRKVEVKLHKNHVPYIKLTNVDLELLGLKRP